MDTNQYIGLGLVLLFIASFVGLITYSTIRDNKKIDALSKLSPEEKKQKVDEFMEPLAALLNFAQSTLPSTVISENGVTVSYGLDSFTALNAEAAERDELIRRTDEKLREILRDNPSVDLMKHQRALGIKIVSIDRKASATAPPIHVPPTPPSVQSAIPSNCFTRQGSFIESSMSSSTATLGSCLDCPKRTGHNKLLFADVKQDACTDPNCYHAKVDAHVAKTVAAKPKLVQISTAYGQQQEGSVTVPRNKYVEIQPDKPATKEEATRPEYKACKFTADAIVSDGIDKGALRKVCTEANCPVHHPKKRPQQIADNVKWKAEQENQRKEQAIAIQSAFALLLPSQPPFRCG